MVTEWALSMMLPVVRKSPTGTGGIASNSSCVPRRRPGFVLSSGVRPCRFWNGGVRRSRVVRLSAVRHDQTISVHNCMCILARLVRLIRERLWRKCRARFSFSWRMVSPWTASAGSRTIRGVMSTMSSLRRVLSSF